MYAANPLDRGRLLYAPSTTVHDPNPPLTLDTPAGGGIPQTLAGTAAAGSAMTGLVNLTVPLTAAEAGTSGATGQLNLAVPVAGSSAGTSVMTGQTSVVHPLAGTSAGTSTTAGNLLLTQALAGTMAGSSTLTGALFVGMSARSTGVGAMTGDLAVTLVFAGEMDGGSIMGDQVLPDPAMYPTADLLPGAGSAELSLTLGLAGTSAGTSGMAGGTTDLAAVAAGSSGLGSWRPPSGILYPDPSLFPGLSTVELVVGTQQFMAAVDAGLSVMTGRLLVGGPTSDPVTITIAFSLAIRITVSFDDPLIESSNEPQVLIGVADG